MKKLLVASLLFLLTSLSYAMPYSEAKAVFEKVKAANNVNPTIQLLLERSNEVNAYADGVTVHVYNGMLKSFRNDNEAALVLGHELGHILLRHHSSSIAHEYAADKEGSVLMSKAGYNICKGAQIFKRGYQGPSSDHPMSKDRYKRLGCGSY